MSEFNNDKKHDVLPDPVLMFYIRKNFGDEIRLAIAANISEQLAIRHIALLAKEKNDPQSIVTDDHQYEICLTTIFKVMREEMSNKMDIPELIAQAKASIDRWEKLDNKAIEDAVARTNNSKWFLSVAVGVGVIAAAGYFIYRKINR